MHTEVTLRDISVEDVDRVAVWLEDEEISSRWFGHAGKDALHRGYDPILMQMASDSEWNSVFRDDPRLLVFSIYDEIDEHIGECQVLLDGEGDAYPSILIGRKDLWHQGYGTSAMTSLIGMLFDFHEVERVTVCVPGANIPARGLFRKLGFMDRESSGSSRWMYLEKGMLNEVDIFVDLTHEQIERVSSLGKRVEVLEGRMLGRAGEPGGQLYVILQGQAELSASSTVGDITVRIAGPGESFPLASLIGSRRLITSVVAMTDMRLLAIPTDQLLSLCSEDTDIGMRIFATIADLLGNRYAKTLSHFTDRAEKSTEGPGVLCKCLGNEPIVSTEGNLRHGGDECIRKCSYRWTSPVNRRR